jgi:ATP/maltotriose-dependent transcriptional regulator MalT
MLANCLITSGELAQADQHINRAVGYYQHTQMTPYLLRAIQTKLRLRQKMGRPEYIQATQIVIEKLIQSLMPDGNSKGGP